MPIYSQEPLRSPGGLSRVLGTVRGLVGAVFLFTTLIVVNVLQMLSLCVRPFSHHAFRAFNRGCANTWWGLCVVSAQWAYGIRPVLTGNMIPDRENAIVFANHQQMPDIVALMMLAWQKRRLGDLKWFVKHPLKYVPGIGWGMQFLDCLFVKRTWNSDRDKIHRTFAKFNRYQIPLWLISFSEGTRFTAKKLARSQQFSRENGLPELKHHLQPRTKGFAASVIGLREHVTAVYDVTIGYGGGIPSLWQFTAGWARTIHMHVRRFPIGVLPENEAELGNWLRQRFQEKDELLTCFLESGKFPQVAAAGILVDSENLIPFVPIIPGGVTPEA